MSSAEADLLAFALTYPEAYEDHPWGERVVKVRKKVLRHRHRRKKSRHRDHNRSRKGRRRDRRPDSAQRRNVRTAVGDVPYRANWKGSGSQLEIEDLRSGRVIARSSLAADCYALIMEHISVFAKSGKRDAVFFTEHAHVIGSILDIHEHARSRRIAAGEIGVHQGMMLYIAILLVGYLYLWKKGALDWHK